MELKLLSCFGEHAANANLKQEDTIDHLSFSQCDRFVASGDQGGNVNIYRIKETGKTRIPLNFTLTTKIQAFSPDFDFYRNIKRDPKIRCLQFCPKLTLNPLLLVGNRMFFFCKFN